MNLETILYFVTHHSETIIQWLFLGILLLSGTLLARTLFAKVSVAVAGGATVTSSLPDLENFLQKIKEHTSKLESISAEKMSPQTAGQVDAQVQTLKKELQSREEEIAKLKVTGTASTAPADADKLSRRIKELESKLAEYEILEDDIADLSLYKEENARLRIELDKLKSGTISSEAPAPAVEVPPVPPGEDIVAEFAQAVGQETVPAAPAQIAMDAPSGNAMSDFESAVKSEKELNAPPAPPPPPAEVVTPSAPPAAVTNPPPSPTSPPKLTLVPNKTTTEAEADDLFAEFASSMPEAEEPAEAGLDTDKMMEEMASLVSIEPSSGTALEDGIDTDKMALEATKLTTKS